MRIVPLLLVLGFACTSSSSGDDAGADAGEGMDASAADVSQSDSALMDDAGAGQDTGPEVDAGAGTDSGADASTSDAGSGPVECSADMPCEGACTGRSCGATWFCVTDAPCTDDIATYCGCDGTTFTGSSTCPPRPFVSMGACPGRGTSCDGRRVTCRIPTPECEPGFVPEVNESGSCWTTRCVPIGDCECASPDECPDPDQYTCRSDTDRCTPYL